MARRSKAPHKMPKDKNINTPVPQQLKADVEALALEEDISVAHYVRRVLERHVEDKKKQPSA